MVYTKEKFIELWNKDKNGGGLTFDDVADCAKQWGLCSNPRIKVMDEILSLVLKECNIKYEEEKNDNGYKNEDGN